LSGDSSWRPVARLRTDQQVLAQIEEHILRGRLRPGDRLPSERDLVEALGVGRSSVREALRALEALGIVLPHTGAGRDSGSIIAGGPSGALSNLLRLHMALARFELRDLVDTRVQLERRAAALAAEHVDEDDLTPLADVLAAMSDPGLTPGAFNELDTSFHVCLASVSGNALLADLMQALRDAVHEQMVLAFERLPDWRQAADRLIEEHRAIYDAIRRRDPSAAAAAVERHIEGFYRTNIDAELDPRHPGHSQRQCGEQAK